MKPVGVNMFQVNFIPGAPRGSNPREVQSIPSPVSSAPAGGGGASEDAQFLFEWQESLTLRLSREWAREADLQIVPS